MGIFDNIKGFSFNKPLNEKRNQPESVNLERIKETLAEKIGGDQDEVVIDSLLDDISHEMIERAKKDPRVLDVFSLFIDPDKVNSFTDYSDKKKQKIDGLFTGEVKNLRLFSNSYRQKKKEHGRFKSGTRKLNLELDRFRKLIQIYQLNSQDLNTNETDVIIRALKRRGQVFTYKTTSGDISVKVGKIGGINDDIDPDHFQLIAQDESKRAWAIPKSDISNYLKKSKPSNKSNKKEELEINKETKDLIKSLISKEVSKQINQITKKESDLEIISKKYVEYIRSVVDEMKKKAGEQEDNSLVIDEVDTMLKDSGFYVFNIYMNKGDDETTVETKIDEIKAEEEAKKPKETKKHREFIRHTMSMLQSALLPEVANGHITKSGGFFTTFKNIHDNYKDMMEDLIYRLGIEIDTKGEWMMRENPDIQYQLSYLDTIRSFLDRMVEEYIQPNAKRASNNYKRDIKSIYLDKKAYIKNKHLSRKINMSDFAGVSLKPNINVELYKTVKIPITDKDLVEKSILNKFKNAFNKMTAMWGGGYVSYQDLASAQSNRKKYQAIMQVVNDIAKGTAKKISGERAEKKVGLGFKKVANVMDMELNDKVKESKNEVIDEDMLVNPSSQGAPSAPGSNFQQPGNTAGDMDTFSLLGPGDKKPKSKKKKKKKKHNMPIMSFDEYMKENKSK